MCDNCGATYQKWQGKCDVCGKFNTLIEQTPEEKTFAKNIVAKSSGRKLDFAKIADVSEDLVSQRISTGIDDLDLVLGGGIMVGGVVLVAGQPGIGKSTLLMQISALISRNKNVLYVSGEENAAQVKSRAQRLLGADFAKSVNLNLASSTSADDVAETIASGEFNLVVVDSMQTMAMADISSAPGTVSQITNSSNVIIRAAKNSNTAVLLVGHVTKDGAIAGPKVMEHLVDVVLTFEGDRYGGFKMVRAVKNRYGSTAEVAIFDMTNEGLKIVENPSAALLAERSDTDGSVVLATMEGNRPLLVEIQALVNATSFGYAKRAASGFDQNRLGLLVAVLERRTKLKLADKDIFINVVGGLKLDDRAADLAVCMAIASAAAERKIGDGAVVFGEVGLGGEIRSARAANRRIDEAKKLGFKFALTPKNSGGGNFAKPASDLRDALNQYLK